MQKQSSMKHSGEIPAFIVRVVPPTTISGWVNNSTVVFAVKAAVLIAVKALLVTVTLGVPADVTRIDLIT